MGGPTASRRWSVTVLCCFINFVQMGLNRMPGLLFPAVMERYNVGRSAAVMPFALTYSLRNLSGPLVSLLGGRFGIRCVTTFGNVLSVIAIAACFVVEDITSFTVLFGGIYGIGFGLGTVLLPELLTEYFDDRLSVANGIVMGGACLAGFILPYVVDNLLSFYGISGTMLLLSGIMFQTVPASLLLWSPKKRNINDKFVLNSICKANDDAKNNTEIVLAVSDMPSPSDMPAAVVATNELKPNATSFLNSDNAQIQVTGYENSMMESNDEDCLTHPMRILEKDSKEVYYKNSSLSVEHRNSCSDGKYKSEAPCSSILNVIYSTEWENENLSNSTNITNSNNKYQGQTFEILSQDNRNRSYDINRDLCCDIKQKSNDSLKYHDLKDNFTEQCTKKPYSDIHKLSAMSLIHNTHPSKGHIQEVSRFRLERKDTKDNFKKSSDEYEKNKSLNNNKLPVARARFNLLFDPAIWFIMFTYSFSVCVFSYLTTIVVDFARDCGVRNGLEVSILMAMAISDAVGRFFLGFVTDCGLLTSAQFFALCMAIASAMFFILTLFNNFETILICCTLYALFHGGTCCVHVKLCTDNVEKDHLSMTLVSRPLLNTPLYLLQPTLIGFFRERHGSYKGLIAVFGVVLLLGHPEGERRNKLCKLLWHQYSFTYILYTKCFFSHKHGLLKPKNNKVYKFIP